MCGRYFIDDGEDQTEMLRILAAANEQYKGTSIISRLKTGEIFPTEVVPVIASAPGRTGETVTFVRLMQWGMFNSNHNKVVINARSESAADKAMFRQSVRQGRVLIPASGFFEWQKQPGSKEKIRHCLHVPGENIFYMAGLWRPERLTAAEAEKLPGEPTADSVINRFVILTMAASEWMSRIHDRMPLIFNREDGRRWLFEAEAAPSLLLNTAASPLATRTCGV